MIREHFNGKKSHSKDPIAWRCHEVSRIEAFSDAVFAFAVTLLVISLEVPHDLDELLHSMMGFIPFAICFALLFQIWYYQNVFFRRFGLDDVYTVVLNAMLLFFVLFFVYPLKFLFTHMQGGFEPDQGRILFYIYSGGFTVIYLLFALMYINAYKKKAALELTDREAFETRTTIYAKLIMAGVGGLSVMCAAIGGVLSPFAGIVYMLIGPVLAIFFGRRGKKHRLLFETQKQPVVKNTDTVQIKEDNDLQAQNVAGETAQQPS